MGFSICANIFSPNQTPPFYILFKVHNNSIVSTAAISSIVVGLRTALSASDVMGGMCDKISTHQKNPDLTLDL